MKKFLLWLKEPLGAWLCLPFLLALALIAGSIAAMLLFGQSPFAYLLYALAAIFLAYSAYALCRLIPRWKQGLKNYASKFSFTEKLIQNYGFRTIIFAVGSLTLSVAYAAFNGTIAVLTSSLWYGALAAYYVMLASMRGGIVFYHRKKKKLSRAETEVELKERELKKYTRCGALLIFLPICLSAAILQMVAFDKSFEHKGLTIYVAAAYTFYKIIMSIVNFVKAKRNDDMTVRAVRNVNLADALVSVLALQTAMFNEFGNAELNAGLMNAVVGGIVCALTALLGAVMLIGGRRQLKTLREAKNERQTLSL